MMWMMYQNKSDFSFMFDVTIIQQVPRNIVSPQASENSLRNVQYPIGTYQCTGFQSLRRLYDGM
jgi:hypothetical protein